MSNRFIWEAGDIKLSSCMSCIYKHRGKATCEAFPLGIPKDILSGDNDHRKPLKGDNGIIYSKMKGLK
ncbi:MAG: hypothetical protein MIO92_06965 [Methanosarcinaceae archaeon]|nr:hypothetical protein [Methanosarcinaceae archaeon]